MLIRLGIIGTKEYRKPEWVTHMEELQAALKGKDSPDVPKKHAKLCVQAQQNTVDTEEDVGKFSCDSIEIEKTITKNQEPKLEKHPSHIFKTHSQDYIDVCGSEDVDNTMLEYLNSRRHSHSTTREFLSHDVLLRTEDPFQEGSSPQEDDFDENYIVEEEIEPMDNPQMRKDSFYILSPIEEHSERADTESIYGSCSSGNKSISPKIPKQVSHSWDHIPERDRSSFKDCIEQYQTLPRAKIPIPHTSREHWDTVRFPTEPRELDPEAYHQLHTADSQEELQEFLLLESECMTDGKNNGLASAFTMSDEGPRIFSKEEKDDRGTMSG